MKAVGFLILSVSDGTLFGFTETNGRLFSEHDDPNITFRNIDDRVRYISIQCSNPNPEALSQVFYRRHNEDWTEQNSITFPLSNSETTVSLPRTIKVTSLRLDLTNTEGDTLFCEGFTLNPEMSFNFSYFRLALFIMSMLGVIWGDKIIPQNISNTIYHLLMHNGIWLFVLMIIFIGFAYPTTITFDSAHYLWLADLIKNGDWASWDLVRTVGFPLQLYFFQLLFGTNPIALKFPLVFAHILLFLFSCLIAFEIFKPSSDLSRFLICLSIFIMIGSDPTLVGYFNTLLTEYASATIAMISSYLAIKLYKTQFLSKQFFLLASLFMVMIPLAWHLKQPYIGSALFPLTISIGLIIIRDFSWKTILVSLGTVTFAIVLVFSSNIGWDLFLESQGNPMRENRHITSYAESSINTKIYQSQSNPTGMISRQVNHYLENINFYLRYTTGDERRPSLTQGFQNRVIGQRMFFRTGESNLLYNFPFYDQFTYNYKDNYAPPNWLNDFFLFRIISSNFLFTTSYLLLPFGLLISLIVWFRKKTLLIAGILILGGTSFLNTLLHLFANPIDRYLILGYPLNLLSLLLVIIQTVKMLHHIFYKGKLPSRNNSLPEL